MITEYAKLNKVLSNIMAVFN